MLHSLIFFQLWINFEIFWTFFFFFLKTQFFNVLLIHCALVVFIMPSKSNSFFSCQTKRISLFDICWISFPHLVKKTPLFSSLIYQNGGDEKKCPFSPFSPPGSTGPFWCVAHDFSILDVSAKKMSYSTYIGFIQSYFIIVFL